MCIAIEAVNQQQQLKKVEDFATVRVKNVRVTFSVRKFLKHLFKQRKSLLPKCKSSTVLSSSYHHYDLESKECVLSLEDEMNGSIESFENSFNSATELAERTSLECYENAVNERLSAAVEHQNGDTSSLEEESHQYPPAAQLIASTLQFVRTDCGTFFWPANRDSCEDLDLIEPLQCNTSNQIAIAQSSPSSKRIYSNHDDFHLEQF